MKKIKLEKVDLDLYSHEYENGFRIFLIPDKTVNFYYMTLNVKFGSLYTKFKRKDEKEYVEIPNGAAHFLEHLTFKTKDGDAMDYFSKLNSDSNAFTTFDCTSYEVSGTQNFDKCLDYLMNYVSTPYYTQELVEREKGIICEEIKSHDDRPLERIARKIRKNLIHKSNYKYDICGTVEDVINTTVEDIKTAYDYFYTPNNMFLVITGNFDIEECKRIVDNNDISKVVCNKSEIEIAAENEPATIVKDFEIVKENLPSSMVNVSGKIKLSEFDKFNVDLVVLKRMIYIILNGMFSSTSDFSEYLEENRLINGDSVNFNTCFTSEYFLLTLTAGSPKPEELIEILKDKINHLEIDEETYRRKTKVELSYIINSAENLYGLNNMIASRIIKYNNIYENYYSLAESLSYDLAKDIANTIKFDETSVVIAKKVD